jgi:hypothetical protein
MLAGRLQSRVMAPFRKAFSSPKKADALSDSAVHPTWRNRAR